MLPPVASRTCSARTRSPWLAVDRPAEAAATALEDAGGTVRRADDDALVVATDEPGAGSPGPGRGRYLPDRAHPGPRGPRVGVPRAHRPTTAWAGPRRRRSDEAGARRADPAALATRGRRAAGRLPRSSPSSARGLPRWTRGPSARLTSRWPRSWLPRRPPSPGWPSEIADCEERPGELPRPGADATECVEAMTPTLRELPLPRHVRPRGAAHRRGRRRHHHPDRPADAGRHDVRGPRLEHRLDEQPAAVRAPDD